jgi:hypothetical protein
MARKSPGKKSRAKKKNQGALAILFENCHDIA